MTGILESYLDFKGAPMKIPKKHLGEAQILQPF